MGDAAGAAVTIAFLPWLGWWGTWAALTVRAAVSPSRRPSGPPPVLEGRVLDVVVPAHDEASTIADLLRSLGGQTGPARIGTVLVVADHCTDETAAVARGHGAEVLERDTGVPGKPPALRAGASLLRARPGRGDAVVFLDADCTVDPRFASAMAERMGAGVRAVQAAYTVEEPRAGAVRTGLRRGFALRNVVRASGADRFGVPCVLYGSGMLFDWDLLDAMSFADPRIGGTGDSRPVADDVLMALDLLAAGVHVRLASDASVVAPTPPDDHALGAQRLRWEGGQALMWQRAPRIARRLLARRDFRGLVGLVDWTAPPLVPTAAAFAALATIILPVVAIGVLPAWVVLVPTLSVASLAVYLIVGISVLEGPAAAARAVVDVPRFVRWKLGLYRNHREGRRPGDGHRLPAA